MDQDEVRRVSEHICDWLDDHAGFSFNALCRQIGADSGNMQKYRKSRCFLEKHLAAIEGELVKVREYVPLVFKDAALPDEVMDKAMNDMLRTGRAAYTEAVGGKTKGFDYLPKGAVVIEDGKVVAEGAPLFEVTEGRDVFENGGIAIPAGGKVEYAYVEVPMHPEQDRFPGRLLEEGIIEYRLRMAEKK